MQIARSMYDELVAHAREDAPDECCGMIGTLDGVAQKVYRAHNDHPNPPLGYNVDSQDLYRISMEIDDAGWELGAIYHSHTRSAPLPSQTDINTALYPDALYVIVGVDGDEPELRAWRIVDGKVDETELEIAD